MIISMDEKTTQSKLLPIGQLIAKTWEQFAGNFKIFWPLSLAVTILLIVLPVLAKNQNYTTAENPSKFILLGLTILVIFLFTNTLAIRLAFVEKKFSEIIKISFRIFFPLLGLGLLTLFVEFGAFTLLIIPGLILALHASLIYYVKITENIGGYKAICRSRQLIKGVFWPVLWRYFILSLIAFAPMAVLNIIPQTGPTTSLADVIYSLVQAFWSLPFIFLGLTALTRELQTQKPDPTTEKKGYFIFCSIWGPFIMMVAVASTIALMGLAILNAQNNLQKIDSTTLLKKYQPQIEQMMSQGKSEQEIGEIIRNQIIGDYTQKVMRDIWPKSWNDFTNRLKLLPQLKTLLPKYEQSKK